MKIGIDFDNTIVNTSVVSKMFLDKYCPGNNLNFDKYIFKAFPKGMEAKLYGLDLVIDDTHEVVMDVRNHNIDALEYGVDVKSWYEVIEYVRKELYGKNNRCK